MPALEHRVRALETKLQSSVRVIWRDYAETDADAMARAGIDPADGGLVVIIVRWAGYCDDELGGQGASSTVGLARDEQATRR